MGLRLWYWIPGWFYFQGKSQSFKWMTGGSPIGNLHMYNDGEEWSMMIVMILTILIDQILLMII